MSLSEEGLKWLKEGVTAAIAMALLVLTWLIVTRALGASGTPPVGGFDPYPRVMQLLAVMTGMLGGALGYYFGRLPTERAAAQAQEAASKAQAETAGVQGRLESAIQALRSIHAEAESVTARARPEAIEEPGGALSRIRELAANALLPPSPTK